MVNIASLRLFKCSVMRKLNYISHLTPYLIARASYLTLMPHNQTNQKVLQIPPIHNKTSDFKNPDNSQNPKTSNSKNQTSQKTGGLGAAPLEYIRPVLTWLICSDAWSRIGENPPNKTRNLKFINSKVLRGREVPQGVHAPLLQRGG